jgi:predicted dehydrogenase
MTGTKRQIERVRFGLIGAGSQGRYLSEAAALWPHVELVACADVNAEAAQKTAAQCGYETAYTSAGEMLAGEKLDAVVVATTHDQLQPMALAAVRAGKHVLVEKPMALNAADGRELVNAARDAGVKLMVGYTLRFMPARILMKRLLEEGVVGQVTHIIAGQCIGAMGGWLGDASRGGGPLLYIGTHVIDQVLWMAERRVERVSAELNRCPDTGVDTDAMVTVRFQGGVLGQVCTSQKLGGRYGWIDVLGTEGRMRAEWESDVLTVESRLVEAYRHLTEIHVPATAYLPVPPVEAKARLSGHFYIRMWGAELAEFCAAIIEDREPCVTGEDGVRVLEIVDAAVESGRTGQPVAIVMNP